jgi:LysR family glycine cleavage system transcriptional activator
MHFGVFLGPELTVFRLSSSALYSLLYALSLCSSWLRPNRRPVHQTIADPIDWIGWQKQTGIDGLDVSAGLVVSDETHAISTAVGGQGVALMSRTLIVDELAEGCLMQPFGPELEGKPFYLVYPESRQQNPTILAIRDWVRNVPGGLCSLSPAASV